MKESKHTLVLLVVVLLLLCMTTTREVDAQLGNFDLIGGASSSLSKMRGGIQSARQSAGRTLNNPASYTKLLKRQNGQRSLIPKKKNQATSNDGRGNTVVGNQRGTTIDANNQQRVMSKDGVASSDIGRSNNNRSFVAKATSLATTAYRYLANILSGLWAAVVAIVFFAWGILKRSIRVIRDTKEWSKVRLEIERERIRDKQTCLPSPVMLYYFSVGLICAGLVGLWDAIDFLLSNILILFLMFLIMVAFLFIQAQGSELVTMAHSSTLLGQRTANKVLGLSNTAADVTEVAVPILNAQSYTSIQTLRMVFNVFIPQDYYMEAFSGSSEDEEAALQEEAMVNQELSRSNGRRLQARVDADGKVQVWNVGKITRDLGLIALKVANIMVLTNMFALILYVIQLKLFVAFLDVILFVLSRVIMKIVCLVGHGNLFCTVREVVALVTVNLIRLILDAIGLGFLIPEEASALIACGESDFNGQAETLAPMCGGVLWDAEPMGASLSGLKLKRISMMEDAAKAEAESMLSNYQPVPGSTTGGGTNLGGRRLSESLGSDKNKMRNWVHCIRDPHDGSFVEAMNGRRLHMTHGKRPGCPHTRDLVLHQVHERAMQFHRLNVEETCLNICLNGLHVLSCYDANQAYHPLLATGECSFGEDGRLSGRETEVNRTMVHHKLNEVFPELSEDARDRLIASSPQSPPPPPPPPTDDWDNVGEEEEGIDLDDDDKHNATVRTTETVSRRSLFSAMSQKIWPKADVVKWLEGEYSGKYVLANKVECDVRKNKAPQGPHEAFIDTVCIAGKYLEGMDLPSTLGGSFDFDSYTHLNRQTDFSLRGIPAQFSGVRVGGRRLSQGDGSVTPQRQPGLSLFEHALDFVKLTDGMRRDARLLRAAEVVGNDTFTRRVLSVVNEKPSFVNVYRNGIGQSLKAFNRLLNPETTTTATTTGNEGRRRRLSTATNEDGDGAEVITTSFQVISQCPANYYLCANGFECVPSDQLDLCSPLEVTEDTGLLAQANQYIQDFTTYEFDLKGYVHEYCYECWRDYDLKPQTNPFQYNADADLSNARYCCGLIEPDLYRFEPLSETGISGFITGICNATSENGTVISNNCFCPWYYPTSLSNTVYVSGFFDLYVMNHILNALVIVQTFVSLYFTGETGVLFFVGYVWRAWAEFYCAGQCAAWFVDIFGTFGIETTAARRLTCVFLHAGSFFYTAFLVFGLVVFYIMVKPAISYMVDFYMAPFRRRLRGGRVRGSGPP